MKKLILSLFVLIFGAVNTFAAEFRFAQIADAKYSKTNNTLEKMIQDINKQKDIKFVVFTGDNIEKVSQQNLLDFIKASKKLNKPFYVVLGDKDVNKHKDLSKKQYAKIMKKHVRTFKDENTNYVFKYKKLVFLVADGSRDVIPSTNGYYKDNVLEWVDANLDLYSKNNVIILQHFPLIPPANKESYYTFKPEKYLEIIKNHPNVKAVITGHFNVNKEDMVDNVVHISTASAPAYRIIDIIDYETSNPTFWAEVREVK